MPSAARLRDFEGDFMTDTQRTPAHAILPLFADRWSPRGFTGEPISDEVLASLFEAARWAPSAFNSQPWRFIWARNGEAEWDPIFNTLVDFNKSWAKTASAIILVASKSTFKSAPDKPEQESGSHAFDTGAAWVSLALQARALGWYAHAASGFDKAAAKANLSLPDDVHPHAIVMVGKKGSPDVLPDYLRSREQPSDRNPVESIAFHGKL
jgi:nitroreductase